MQILNFELATLTALLAAGEVSARDAVAASLDALETTGRKLNCIVAIHRDEAMEAAERADKDRSRGKSHGRLHGVPMAHKDLFEVAGRIVAAGSKIRAGYRAGGTASAMRKLAEAGAINIGSLHMSELALSPTGYNAHLGYCRNPWNTDFIAGGSSSGSGAAVAARLVPASLGSDTGGSARVPAAACGITALKPTFSLIAKDGVLPLSLSLDCISPMARSAVDCALLLDVIAGPDAADPATLVAPQIDYSRAVKRAPSALTMGLLPDTLLARVDPEVVVILDRSVAVFKDLGVTFVEVNIDDLESFNVLNRTVLVVEAATLHRHALVDRPQDFSPHVRSRLQTGLNLPATRYVEALTLRGKLARRFVERAFANADLLLMPCIPVPVPSISEDREGEVGTGASDIMDFTRAMNYLGLPAASVPAGFTANGLPASFQLVGRHFDEVRILAAARAYQQATDWHTRHPPIQHRGSDQPQQPVNERRLPA
jgi:aspartyl-tRNA(Asn)/glutamyl-tRNA(Gln) amidotransferase subunit A